MSKAIYRRMASVAFATGCALASVLVLASCATPTRHELFLLFFDQEELPPAATNQVAETAAVAPVAATGGVEAVAVAVHEPYKDKSACNECHISKSSQKLKTAMPALCYACHDDLKTGQAVVHAPVDEGTCMDCHTPHVAKVAKLLVKPPDVLCFDCHDRPSKKFVHQPFADGDCAACHVPHASKLKALARKTTPDLCHDCHDSKDVAAVKEHAEADGKGCLDCHEAHEAAEAKLLKKAAARR